MISFDSEHLRLIWNIVEAHSHVLQNLSDDALCMWLQQKIRDNIQLSPEDMDEIQAYVLSRSHLIRDITTSQRL